MAMSRPAFVLVAALCGCAGARAGFNPVAAPPAAQPAPRNLEKADLLYVSGYDSVYVFSYPVGHRVQTLQGLQSAGGLCVDAAGDVFVPNLGRSDILEYAHGGLEPMARLFDDRLPNDCAVDPTNGNLAVANLDGGVSIFQNAQNHARQFTDRKLKRAFYLDYDRRGNLFVDGESVEFGFVLAELPAGQKKFVNIALDQTIGFPGGVGWDGLHVVVGDQSTSLVYRFSVAGTRGTNAGTVQLNHAFELGQFLIRDRQIMGADSARGMVMTWRYPAGGDVVKTIGNMREPFGLTVSHAMKPLSERHVRAAY